MRGAPGGAAVDVIAETSMRRWLVDAVNAWDGPRLREALQKADRKRRSRPDENGVTAAFGGEVLLSRNRSSEVGVCLVCVVVRSCLTVASLCASDNGRVHRTDGNRPSTT